MDVKDEGIRQFGRYEIRPEAMEKVLSAIREFVAYLRANEPGVLRYDVWQEKDHLTRFVHIFLFSDAAAEKVHSESKAVAKFSSILYPECLQPVEFIDFIEVSAK